jgi:mono/diheme cytochrome c family protein
MKVIPCSTPALPGCGLRSFQWALLLLALAPLAAAGGQNVSQGARGAGQEQAGRRAKKGKAKGGRSKRQAQRRKVYLTSYKPSQAAGLFSRLCARCHAADGTGNTGRRRSGMPDFTRVAWQERRSNVQLRVSISEGQGQGMPGFGGRLSSEEIGQLVAHVRAFAPLSKANTKKADRGDFEARFRALEEELEKLRREFWELVATSRRREDKADSPKGQDR